LKDLVCLSTLLSPNGEGVEHIELIEQKGSLNELLGIQEVRP